MIWVPVIIFLLWFWYVGFKHGDLELQLALTVIATLIFLISRMY